MASEQERKEAFLKVWFDAPENIHWAHGMSNGVEKDISDTFDRAIAAWNTHPASVATPADATDEMVEAALAVDWDNEDERATVHNIWHAMTAKLPSSPAPAATDTGLETVGYMANYEGVWIQVGELLGSAVVTHSQAEELLAAERVETERLHDSSAPMACDPNEWTAAEEILAHLLINVVGAPDDVTYTPDEAQDAIEKSIGNLKADNAAQAARIKEREQERDEYRDKWQSIMEQEKSSRKTYLRHTEALETKLAAAEAGRDRVRRIFRRNTRLRFEAEKRAEVIEAKFGAAEKTAFEHGYVLACCNIVNLHDEPTIAHCTLSELGITREAVKDMNLSEYDLKALRKIERDRSRSPYAKASRKARAVLGGKP